MTSLSQVKLLTQILNLESVRVTKYRNLSGIGLIIHLEALAKKASCDRCGQQSHQVHQNHRYLVKDLPISGQAVYLEVNRRQFKCKNCGKPFSEELDFVTKRRQYTSRLAREIVRQVLADDIKTVAENNDVSMEEIETMLKDYGKKLKLEKVIKVCPTLGKMHELKEKFRDIFEKIQDRITGLLKISDWLKEAATYYPESKKTIMRWIGEIIAYFDERITNGVVEGINNKIKLIKRSAYGFRNFDNFRTRVLLSWHFNY